MISATHSFKPKFSKPMASPVGDGTVEIPLNIVDDITEEVLSNRPLIDLMRRYVRDVRSTVSSATEEEDIAMRKQIFPYFQERLRKMGKEYSLFSADVTENIFQKIELGEI
ncbi:MAG: hypothetical protein GY717_15700 [Rhodobacteraceae bacterium]|nr:hypothetical protein [Paracoccaceae bacterium]